MGCPRASVVEVFAGVAVLNRSHVDAKDVKAKAPYLACQMSEIFYRGKTILKTLGRTLRALLRDLGGAEINQASKGTRGSTQLQAIMEV